jgi:hypothetical protein
MQIAVVRDIAIVVLAFESIVIGVVLALLLWQVRSLTRLLQQEVKPILDSARETVGTVKGTTNLVSRTIVQPAVKIGSLAAGVRRAWEVILDLKPRPQDSSTSNAGLDQDMHSKEERI